MIAVFEKRKQAAYIISGPNSVETWRAWQEFRFYFEKMGHLESFDWNSDRIYANYKKITLAAL